MVDNVYFKWDIFLQDLREGIAFKYKCGEAQTYLSYTKTQRWFRNIFYAGVAQLVRAFALLGKLQREGSLWKIQKNQEI